MVGQRVRRAQETDVDVDGDGDRDACKCKCQCKCKCKYSSLRTWRLEARRAGASRPTLGRRTSGAGAGDWRLATGGAGGRRTFVCRTSGERERKAWSVLLRVPSTVHPHFFVSSFPRCLISSFPHSLIASFPHFFIPAFHHTVIPSCLPSTLTSLVSSLTRVRLGDSETQNSGLRTRTKTGKGREERCAAPNCQLLRCTRTHTPNPACTTGSIVQYLDGPPAGAPRRQRAIAE